MNRQIGRRTKFPPEIVQFLKEQTGKSNKEQAALVNNRYGKSFTSKQIKNVKYRHCILGNPPFPPPGKNPFPLFSERMKGGFVLIKASVT